jgi:predicted enzyme related to lactoylglutathione lyase
MSGRVVHFEMPYDDGARAKAFYRDLFGWELVDWEGAPYTLVSTGPSGDQGPTEPGFINGGIGPRSGPDDHPRVVVDVDDIDRTLAAVQDRGGTVVLGRQPVGDMGFTAYFTDTEGNRVGLWENAPRG